MLSSDEQEELNEQAAQYHREDTPWEMMVNMQPPTGKGELKHSGLSEEQLENLIQKIVIAVKKEAQLVKEEENQRRKTSEYALFCF